MRKITLFLMSLFLTVGAMAQYGTEVYVTDLSQLSNDKVYTLESARCYLMYNTTANATGISSSNSTSLNDSNRPAKSKDDVNQQFKIENIDGSYYLYSVGAGKYVTDNGSFADTPQQALNISASSNASYPWFLKIGSNGMNSQDAGQNANGIVINSYVTEDAGNCYRILDVEEERVPLNLTFEEVGNPAEDGVYRIYWKQDNRGYLAYHDSYPTKGVLADVTLGSHGSKHFNSATDPVQLEWYLITSGNDNKYLFSAYNGKFLSYSEESANAAKAAYFDAARPCPITIADNTSHSGYYIIKANVDGTDCLLSSGCGTASTTGYPIRWNSNISGDMADGGSPLIFVKVSGLEVDADILARAQAAINDYENPVEDDVNFGWTTSSPWTAVEHYTSTVFNDNELDGVKYIEGEVTVGGARTATVTFTFTSGSHKLNIRGVEVIDEKGNIVAGDYHEGTAGGSAENTTNNIYTVNVAEAGTYTVRCYAAEGGGDQFDSSNGSIAVSFAKLDVMDLTKSVTFAAEYATLYLGYNVAIPAGVQAFAVTAINDDWVTLTKIENTIPANTAVILKGTANSSYKFYYTSGEAENVEKNYLEGSIADRYIQGDAYVLGIPEGETEPALCKAVLNKVENTSFKNNANKAYLPIASGAAMSASLRFDFGGTTGIEEVEIRNEKEEIYDLTGRRVNEITKAGVYIVNGKKVLVK